jgi:protoporphyrinogen oxidase
VVGHRDTVSAIRAAVEASPTLALAGAGLGGNGLAGTIAQSITVPAQLPRH